MYVIHLIILLYKPNWKSLFIWYNSYISNLVKYNKSFGRLHRPAFTNAFIHSIDVNFI